MVTKNDEPMKEFVFEFEAKLSENFNIKL